MSRRIGCRIKVKNDQNRHKKDEQTPRAAPVRSWWTVYKRQFGALVCINWRPRRAAEKGAVTTSTTQTRASLVTPPPICSPSLDVFY